MKVKGLNSSLEKERRPSFSYHTNPTLANDLVMKYDKTIFLRANHPQHVLSSLNSAFVEYNPLSYINSENFITNIF